MWLSPGAEPQIRRKMSEHVRVVRHKQFYLLVQLDVYFMKFSVGTEHLCRMSSCHCAFPHFPLLALC